MTTTTKIVSKKTESSRKTKKVATTETPREQTVSTPAPTEQVDNVAEDNNDELVDEEDGQKTNVKRQQPTRESILSSFDEIIQSIETEMSALRETDGKTKGIKFLRTLNKRIKVLKNQSTRVIKQKRSSTKKVSNNNSGFLKPVKISKEMAKFTGWNADEPKSRVEITKYICAYIKDNNLQNPEDRRQILADSKLAKLLRYDPKKETEPLTYFRIQSCLKSHFPKVEEVTA